MSEQVKHIMKVDSIKKVFNIDLFGSFGLDDAQAFFADYEKYTKPLPKKDYNIVINCKELSVFKQDVLEGLELAYKAYAEFKGVHFINPPTATGKMQLKRVAKQVNLDQVFNFVEDEKDLKLV